MSLNFIDEKENIEKWQRIDQLLATIKLFLWHITCFISVEKWNSEFNQACIGFTYRNRKNHTRNARFSNENVFTDVYMNASFEQATYVYKHLNKHAYSMAIGWKNAHLKSYHHTRRWIIDVLYKYCAYKFIRGDLCECVYSIQTPRTAGTHILKSYWYFTQLKSYFKMINGLSSVEQQPMISIMKTKIKCSQI